MLNTRKITRMLLIALVSAVLIPGCVPPPMTVVPSLDTVPSPTLVTPTLDTATPPLQVTEGGLVFLSAGETLRKDAETYAKRYGITVEEAIACMHAMDGISALNVALHTNEADTFGGLWVEHEPNFRVVILFTRNGEQTIRPYLTGKDFAHLVEVRQVRFTLAELETIYAQATHELAKLDFGVSTLLSVQDNRVQVPVSDPVWFESELRRVGARLPEGVELTVVKGGPTARDRDLLLTPPVPDIAFPRQKPVEGVRICMESLLVGTLRLENGCLYVQSSGSDRGLVPIWPPEFTLRMEGNQVLVIDGKGQVAARSGEEVYMGGGDGSVDAWVLQQIPPACRRNYFIVGCEVRPNLKYDSTLFALDILSDTARTVLFLRYKPTLEAYVEDAVSISGRLVVDEYNRCLHLQAAWGPATLFWPAHWSARFEGETIVVIDETGHVVARTGDEVRLRTRTIPESADVPIRWQLIHELPGGCVSASWLVDGVD
ncbi:MAG: hypothetical protein JXR84_22415 [Anaerolineae bacterium]|nr:hypothetical protein [Anaerolineae bacterium]